jgi:hypothetical protein
MATQTLAQAAFFIDDEIVSGVCQDIIDINPIFDVLPFSGYEGQGFVVNRELTLGGTEVASVGATITSTAKGASTFTQKVFKATKLIGDAEMDGLVQAQSMGGGVDQTAIEIMQKAKSVGRLFQTGMAQGTGTSPAMNSLHSLVDATQFASTTTAVSLTFEYLDELLDLVKSKDGIVDWIMMPARTIRSYKALLRGLGGTPADWMVDLPPSQFYGNGRKVIGYEGIPIFKNEFLSVTETTSGAALTGGVLTSVWAGNFDDGSQKIGIAGIHPIAVPAGIMVHPVGAMEAKDVDIWRVKQYANFANFNRKGLARLPNIKD